MLTAHPKLPKTLKNRPPKKRKNKSTDDNTHGVGYAVLVPRTSMMSISPEKSRVQERRAHIHLETGFWRIEPQLVDRAAGILIARDRDLVF
jgi:hypothetical protein